MRNPGARHEDLRAAEEAVTKYRHMAAAQPEAMRPDLADALNTLGIRLREARRRKEALWATQEAVELYRELAAARPDTFRPDLAGVLSNLGDMLSGLGRSEEALAATEEAATMYRELARTRPDASGPYLLMALNNLSARLNDTFAEWMRRLVRTYLRICGDLQRQPDAQALPPILEEFRSHATDIDPVG